MDEKAVNGGTEMPIQFVGRNQVKGIIPDNLQGEYGKTDEGLRLVRMKDQKINAQNWQNANTEPSAVEEKNIFEISEDDLMAGWIKDVLHDLPESAACEFAGGRKCDFEIQRHTQRDD